MTLLTEPTRIVLAKGYSLPDDADAVAYIAAVEAADGQALETATRMAINSFVKGCKADGIWPAIKASCILAGARTLAGALTPLVGTAPTNVGPFVSGDYNRKTGLVGDGSTKYLNSNRNNNADPQDNKHVTVYASTAGFRSGFNAGYFGYLLTTSGGTGIWISSVTSTTAAIALNSSSFDAVTSFNTAGFIGLSRASSSTIIARGNSTSSSISKNSAVPLNGLIHIFKSNDNSGTESNARLAFYSIGESLNLALLDARVTTLINAFAAAIP